jgi:hypothetical protein
MATNNSSKKRGRSPQQKYFQLRGKAFEIVWKKWKEGSFGSLIDYEEAKNILKVDPKSVRAIFRDISDISPEVAVVAEGVRVGRPTFYHSSCRTAGELKSALFDKCVDLVPPAITLACGPGSTVAYCVRHLVQAGRYHVIVTNNVGIIDQVGGSEINDLVFVGGEYNARIHGCVGNDAVKGFGKVTCQAALVGISGINGIGDLFVRHSDEVPVVSKMVQTVSDYIFIVADIRKFIQVDTWKFIGIPQLFEEKPNRKIYLITNSYESLEEKNRDRAKQVVESLEKMGVKVELSQ